MFTNGHKNVTNEESDEDDLDFDMWEGQFEFVGPNVVQNGWNEFFQTNGFKKPYSNQV